MVALYFMRYNFAASTRRRANASQVGGSERPENRYENSGFSQEVSD
jgi:hypothetical protein